MQIIVENRSVVASYPTPETGDLSSTTPASIATGIRCPSLRRDLEDHVRAGGPPFPFHRKRTRDRSGCPVLLPICWGEGGPGLIAGAARKVRKGKLRPILSPEGEKDGAPGVRELGQHPIRGLPGRWFRRYECRRSGSFHRDCRTNRRSVSQRD